MKKSSIGVILVISVLLSFICGALGAYMITSDTVVSNVISNVTEEKVVENSIADSVSKVYDAVVVVEGFNNGQLVSTGTGFVYKENGNNAYIMTNNHVISGCDSVEVIFSDNSEASVRVMGSEVYSDIAVLSVERDKILSIASMGDTESLRVGDTLFTVGSPEGVDYAGTVTKGILSGRDRLVAVALSGSNTSDYYMKVIQTDAAINPGNSGGPICNINGEVVGITNMKLVNDDVEGMGFAIPIEDALFYAATLETGNQVVRPYFGISMIDITDSYYLWQYGISVPNDIEEGVAIIEVVSGSPADRAGLRRGDIIVSLGEDDVSSVAEFRYALYKHNVGDEVEVKYVRNGNEDTVRVKLTSS